jgi:hypothetical protein
MEVLFERGIGFDIAVVIKAGPDVEKKLKRGHHHARYCPLCGSIKLRDYRD